MARKAERKGCPNCKRVTRVDIIREFFSFCHVICDCGTTLYRPQTSLEEDLRELRRRIGAGPTRSLRVGGVYKVWRRTSPWNEWVESARGQQLWHSHEGCRYPDRLKMFELVEDSLVKVGDCLPPMARTVISRREWSRPDLSVYRLKKEYRA